MRSGIIREGIRTPWASLKSDRGGRSEGGFTLIELLIVCVIVPMVVGAITIALISVFSLQGSVTNRITDSGDAQVVSANYESDVQSATSLTTNNSSTGPAPCGSNGQLLGLTWGNSTEISYAIVGNELVRNVCNLGSSTPTTPKTTSVVSHDVPTLASGNITATVSCNTTLSTALTSGMAYSNLNVGQLPAAVATNDPIVLGTGSSALTLHASGASPSLATVINAPVTPTVTWPVGTQVTDNNWTTIGSPTYNCGSGTAWISTFGVTSVTLTITEPGGGHPYIYTLDGLPGASSSQNLPTTAQNNQNTSCNFAAPNSGTYASTLCFVDFTPFNAAAPSTPCQQMTAAVVGTTYTMSFCLSVTGGPVAPATIPTYFNPPTSEAFLGNNGFYTGIPGNPALYQSCEGSDSACGGAVTTATFTNILVTESNGQPATGWELVTGDAESTDSSESMTWTSNQNLNLLPNSGTVQNPSQYPYGNDCATSLTPPYNAYNPSIPGAGTTSVTCASTVDSDKTGAVMLAALAATTAPLTLTVNMIGTGLEAVFLGMILPS